MADFRLDLIGIDQMWTSYKRIGKYAISIKAGLFFFSTPRKFVPDINAYKTMEIALFDEDDNWVQPRDSQDIMMYNKFHKLLSCYETGDVAVGKFVPIDLIQDLYNYLEQY